jgi:acyl-coenzyme A synthetase/AMP-(fatty) acid ligase
MLADGGVSVVVGVGDTVGDLPVGRVRTVVLDDVSTGLMLAGQPAGAPQVPMRPDQLAYVMFTSGATQAERS